MGAFLPPVFHMAQEIELKLALPIRFAPRLRQHPVLASSQPDKRCIRNLYLDTPEQLLRQKNIALRRRQLGQTWLLTVKTADVARNGLSCRHEWEYPMPPDQLDFSPIEAQEIRTLLEQQIDKLELVFRTDFVRTAWHIPHEGAQIEVALDLGHIRTQHRRTSIHEVELELLSGPQASLTSLAQHLQQSLPLTPLAPSKAARGFALLNAL